MSHQELKLTSEEVATAIRVYTNYLAEQRCLLHWPPKNGTRVVLLDDVPSVTVCWDSPD